MKRKVTIELGGRSYAVTPDFEVIGHIEDRFDLMSFINSFRMQKMKTKDVAWVLFCALSNIGEDLSYNDVGNIVLDDITQAQLAAIEIVTAAVNSGPEKPSKKKAPTEAASGRE